MRGKISLIGINGDGLTEVEGEKYYIPFTAPEDEVVFDIVKEKKRQRLVVEKLMPHSPHRHPPPCLHFGVCGGCKLQHLSKEFYEEYKVGLLKKALAFYGVEAKEILPLEIVAPHRRRRISLSFAHRYEGLLIGYMARGSKQIIDNKECHLVLPEIEKIIPEIRQLLSTLFTRRESGQVDILTTSQGLDINLKTGYLKTPSLDQVEMLTNWAKDHNLARLLLNYRPLVTFRNPKVSFSGVPVAVEAGKFLQASDDADTIMLRQVASFLPANINRGVDLFSGRGTFTFLLSQHAPTDAFECENDAILALEEAAKRSLSPITVHKRDLFTYPLTAEELKVYDFIFVDPPRAGALAQVSEITASPINEVVYISCNPSSFARDAQILCEGGFSLEAVLPLDQFLWSEHLEVVAKFSR